MILQIYKICFLQRTQAVDQILLTGHTNNPQPAYSDLYPANPLIKRLRAQYGEEDRTERWMEDHFGKKDEEKEIVLTEDVKVKTCNEKGSGNPSYKTNKEEEEKLENQSSNFFKQSSGVVSTLIEEVCREKEEKLMESMEKEMEKRMERELDEVTSALQMKKQSATSKSGDCLCYEENRDPNMNSYIGKVEKDDTNISLIYIVRFTE